MKFSSLFFIFYSSLTFATDCSSLKDSGDGVPSVYFQQECLGDKAFDKGNYSVAAKYYQKASEVIFFEAPNYRIRLKWGESLCHSGNKREGIERINSFILMAKADLGEFECPENIQDVPMTEHMHVACIGYGSVLSEKAKLDLNILLDRAKVVTALCENK